MNEIMRAAARELAVRGRLTFPTGASVELSGAQILNFSVDEGADSALLPGSVLSAAVSIELANDAGQWRYGGSIRGERPLVGSTLELSVVAGGEELPCGVFVISGVSAGEHSGRVRLTGSDSIASELAFAVEDALAYPATLSQVWTQLVGQTRYAWSGSVPNGGAVIDVKPDWKNATLRRAMGFVAQAAGCFVRVGRTGALELVPCIPAQTETLGPDAYMSLSDGFEAFGPVDGLSVTPVGAEDAVTVGGGTGETLSIADNPLFVSGAEHLQSLLQGTLSQLRGLTLNRMEFRWRGSPDVGVGALVNLTDTAGTVTPCTITRQTMRFENGFSATCTCSVPNTGDAGVVRAITPEGGVNAGALTGTVDGGLLAAGSVVANKLAAGSVTAEKIAAGSVSADKITAGAVTADKLAANAVDAQSIQAVTAAFGRMTAGEIATNELYAALAHVMSLAAGSIEAGNVKTDRLAAVLAEIVTLYAATGDFDFATIQNLISGALVLDKGVLDSVLIANLAVTSANLLSATLGELVLKGDDGKYYAVSVGSDGRLGAEEVTVSEDEMLAGTTSQGQMIVETTANIGSLNASTVKASQAVLGTILTESMNAGKITAGQALIASATIPKLYVTAIDAIGGSLNLTANTAIKSIVGSAEMTNDSVSGLTKRVEMNENRLSGMSGAANAQTEEIERVRSEVEQLADQIGLKVTKEELETWLRFTMLGLELGRSGSAYSTLIDDAGFHIRQYGEDIAAFAKRELAVPTLRVAPPGVAKGATMRAAADGGILI